jgi:hypothetical protein
VIGLKYTSLDRTTTLLCMPENVQREDPPLERKNRVRRLARTLGARLC